MNAPIARLTATDASGASERRREPRFRTSAHAWLVPANGETAQVILADVSAQGCCVRCPAGTLRSGQFIGIALDAEEPLQAVIRWVRDGAVGMEFVRPVPTARTDWHALMDAGYDF